MKANWELLTTKKVIVVILVLAVILGAIGEMFREIAYDKKQEAIQLNEKLVLAIKGDLSPFDIDKSREIVLHLGTVSIGADYERLSKGFDLASVVFINFAFPFSINFNDGKISVSANITNSENQIVAYIENNTWKSVSPESLDIGDRNYNAYAFEIVDRQYVPIFSVEIINTNEVQIAGVFHNGNDTTVISNNGKGIEINPSEKPSTFLTTLFNYPSNSHFGELINPLGNQVSSLNNLADQAKSDATTYQILGYFLWCLSALILAIVGAGNILFKKAKNSSDGDKSIESKGIRETKGDNYDTIKRRKKQRKKAQS